MAERADLLFELGTEELPPTALKSLSGALQREFAAGLEKAGLDHGEITPFATPRRLALRIEALALAQPDREMERRGPALQAAFDADGRPTRAAEGFARSCGTTVEQLQRIRTDKGEWLAYRIHEKGRRAAELLPAIAETALGRLPIPKRMRWGDSDAQFVRPVHWLLFLHGDQVIPCTLLDARAGRETRGHRFHHPGPIPIDDIGRYEQVLEEQGKVIAHFDRRARHIEDQVQRTAETIGAVAQIDPNLLEEVTALVEWPQPIAAGFEERFLEVPHEALILTMKKNQKYFHLLDGEGRLVNHFITIANIESPTPEVIKEGNERVIRPRLADAMFFWEQDGKRRLEDHVDSLKEVVFQQQLGSMYEKSERVATLAAWIAGLIDGDPAMARRAAMLSRCDLMTEMVYEFPEMQGIMGRYQARRDGEPEEIATAMDEFYMPRFSGDRLPTTRTGIAIALAERIDTLTGIIGIGQRPSGDKDPFALRRAALGALRIMKEHALPIPLQALLEQAASALAGRITGADTLSQVRSFMLDRLKGIYLEQGIPATLFEAVAAVHPDSVADFDRRIQGLVTFERQPEAEALAAANKRIRNILRKAGEEPPETVDETLFGDDAERNLHRRLTEKAGEITPLLERYDYEAVLLTLAALRQPVDEFFDRVMVMADDPAVRRNRLALLNQLSRLFLQVADISHL
ncbi:MAG TPA: glycine--tRNA ligase subunit beta [Sedimenticola thiotaurini]|uniref:Glycine--tRNA ligase beta subunit n=1 Tax=Sedimenticola thiotaurini TaxID=1543721 RepID=A0A831W806_9GAMM|nr:glycine--tRNA ligase subunit beta [Sedimenticola thiotaurini]